MSIILPTALWSRNHLRRREQATASAPPDLLPPGPKSQSLAPDDLDCQRGTSQLLKFCQRLTVVVLRVSRVVSFRLPGESRPLGPSPGSAELVAGNEESDGDRGRSCPIPRRPIREQVGQLVPERRLPRARRTEDEEDRLHGSRSVGSPNCPKGYRIAESTDGTFSRRIDHGGDRPSPGQNLGLAEFALFALWLAPKVICELCELCDHPEPLWTSARQRFTTCRPTVREDYSALPQSLMTTLANVFPPREPTASIFLTTS